MAKAKVKYEVRTVISDGVSMLNKEFKGGNGLKAIKYAEKLDKEDSERIYVKEIKSEVIWQNQS